MTASGDAGSSDVLTQLQHSGKYYHYCTLLSPVAKSPVVRARIQSDPSLLSVTSCVLHAFCLVETLFMYVASVQW